MRSLKRTILAAALLISFSAAGATLGNDVSAASLQAAEPAGPVSNTGRDYRIALINFDEHRQRRFDKEDNDRDHRFDERRQRRFDKDDNDRGHRFDEHRQRRFDKDKDPGRGRPGGRHHDRNERRSAAPQPEDAQF